MKKFEIWKIGTDHGLCLEHQSWSFAFKLNGGEYKFLESFYADNWEDALHWYYWVACLGFYEPNNIEKINFENIS